MADENFDIELERTREHLERRFNEALAKAIADLEKRTLVNHLANGLQHCRLCDGRELSLNPAATELEKLWHEGNHGRYLAADHTRELPLLPSAWDWEAWEAAVKARRK